MKLTHQAAYCLLVVCHETRCIQGDCRPYARAILSLLALQAMTPNAIAGHFESSRQALSKHIKKYWRSVSL